MADWRMTGTYFKSCSCDPGCPCDFMAEPTHHYARGSSGWRCARGISTTPPSTGSSGLSPSKASVGRGRCVLRATGGPVDLDRDPAGGGLRVDQFKCCVRAGGGK